ncbi:glycosyltransferase [Saccharicrinis sp. 156]|uniref:glycosyltransferase n=1 Tax=Saccharicrinis sp. 156 TaxID=3417574 RepID=UPI003D346B04
MKVLLLGEFSGMHQNLAIGLRKFGVDVTVASDGDGWKNYPRDIDLSRDIKRNSFLYLLKLLRNIPNLSGYDVVQLNCPKPFNATATFNRIAFNFLKQLNKNIFLGAHGMDTRYISFALDGKLKYSVFQIPSIQNDPHIKELRNLIKYKSELKLNDKIASQSKGIIASSIGYYLSYTDYFSSKTTYIPLSIDTTKYTYTSTIGDNPQKIKFFLGMMEGRIVRKGTDIIHKVLLELKRRYPNDVELTIVKSVPFNEYQNLLNSSHVLCDQMYAYGIGLNGLIAQAKGLIVCGGADEEMYKALGEQNNKPIVNINVSEDEMLKSFEFLIKNKDKLKEISIKNRAFVVKHHDSKTVANRYIEFWKEKIETTN